MTKYPFAMLLGALALPLSANEIRGPEPRNIDGLGQMARLHAQKACERSVERRRSACEADQIRALAETMASVPALRPVYVLPGEFAAMIESRAAAGSSGDWRARLARDDAPVDCRINVC